MGALSKRAVLNAAGSKPGLLNAADQRNTGRLSGCEFLRDRPGGSLLLCLGWWPALPSARAGSQLSFLLTLGFPVAPELREQITYGLCQAGE